MNTILLIVLQTIAYGLIFLSAYLYMNTKSRSRRLENTQLIEIALRIEGLHVLPIRFYLPPSAFVKNMVSALKLRYQEIRTAWSFDKEDVKKTWSEMSFDRKRDFLTTLSKELTEAVECYSPKGDLSSILCPTLKSKNLVDGCKDGSGESNVCVLFDFITAEDALENLEMYPHIDVIRVKEVDEVTEALNSIGAPEEVLKEAVDGGNVVSSEAAAVAGDENENTTSEAKKTDSNPATNAKAKECKLFLQTLKSLCYYLYARQFLARVAVHSQTESKIYTIAKQSARSAVWAGVAGLCVWLLNKLWSFSVADESDKLEL